MELKEYENMYETEDSHWWFMGKRKIVFSQLDRIVAKKSGMRILDIGCGTGIMMKFFEKYGEVSGVDVEMSALRFCSKRGLSNLAQGSVLKLPFKDESFDLVGIFDVLYHKAVTDDVVAMKEIFRILRKEGYLVLTDSADMKLWSRHDVAAHARERYTVSKLGSRLKSAGFKIKKISYFNTLLYPVVFTFRKLDNIFSKDKPVKTNIEKTNEALNKIFYSIFASESKLLEKSNLPFGVSVIAIAKKE